MMRIAFFGLGAMGASMAKRLLEAGFPVNTAIHRSRAVADVLSGIGLQIFPTFAAASQDADVIITMLPADEQIKQVLLDEHVVRALKPGAIVIEMSSCKASTVQEIDQAYQPLGVQLIDAPVSGGVDGAEAGTLTIFGSGSEEAIETVQPILSILGKQIYRLGKVGNGKTYKNLNNLMSLVNLQCVLEVCQVVKSEGIDPDLFYEVILNSSGVSHSFKTRFKRILEERFDPGFKIGLARKDVANALAVAPDLPMPVSRLVYELMLGMTAFDDLDMSAMIKQFD